MVIRSHNTISITPLPIYTLRYTVPKRPLTLHRSLVYHLRNIVPKRPLTLHRSLVYHLQFSFGNDVTYMVYGEGVMLMMFWQRCNVN
jgi:hypothetical protein